MLRHRNASAMKTTLNNNHTVITVTVHKVNIQYMIMSLKSMYSCCVRCTF